MSITQKSMTRKQIFLEAAEAFIIPYEERTDQQKYITVFGLCHAVETITNWKALKWTNKLFDKFSLMIKNDPFEDYYWIPTRSFRPYTSLTTHEKQHKTENDELRGMAACLFANMPAENFKKLIK